MCTLSLWIVNWEINTILLKGFRDPYLLATALMLSKSAAACSNLQSNDSAVLDNTVCGGGWVELIVELVQMKNLLLKSVGTWKRIVMK